MRKLDWIADAIGCSSRTTLSGQPRREPRRAAIRSRTRDDAAKLACVETRRDASTLARAQPDAAATGSRPCRRPDLGVITSRAEAHLLELDLGAGLFELLLDVLGLGLGDAFLEVLGAPSTRSFASLRPRPVISRTTLMTLILFAPASSRTTVNSVFSSQPRRQPRQRPAATATATGAALTPHLSSSVLIELGDLDDRQVREVIDDLVLGDISHCTCSPSSNRLETYESCEVDAVGDSGGALRQPSAPSRSLAASR